MVQIHNVKIQREFADAVLCGDKPFEIRYNDRGYQTGDLIRFRVMNGMFESFESSSHKLSKKTYRITYVLSGWGLQEGYVVLGIKEETTDDS